MQSYHPTQTLPELAQGVFEATHDLAALAATDDGFLVWSRPLWDSIATGGWLEILADALSADADPQEVREALDGVAGFEYSRIPGPLATNVGFAVPLLRALGADELLARLGAGEVAATAWVDGALADGVLDGVAAPVTGARHASILLVVAGDGAGGRAVVAIDAARDGVSVTPFRGLDAGAEPDRVELRGVRVGAADILTTDAALIDDATALYSLVLSSFAVGGAEALLERTVTYVQERHQFGVPIGSFQAVKHMVADMKVGAECSRSIVHVGADSLLRRDDSRLADVAAARLHSARMYRRVAELAIQCHGGFGYTWEQGLHYYYKSALHSASLPTSPVEQRRIIAAQLRLGTPIERTAS